MDDQWDCLADDHHKMFNPFDKVQRCMVSEQKTNKLTSLKVRHLAY